MTADLSQNVPKMAPLPVAVEGQRRVEWQVHTGLAVTVGETTAQASHLGARRSHAHRRNAVSVTSTGVTTQLSRPGVPRQRREELMPGILAEEQLTQSQWLYFFCALC